MTLDFTKMHGCGNDYIYLNCFDGEPDDPSSLSILLSDRHKAVGSDGLVLICRPQAGGDARMRMFNADGSEGKMCGNAIRCVGKYLYDNGIVKKENLSIETRSGTKSLKLEISGGVAVSAEVDMGFASFEPKDVPVSSDCPFVMRPVVCGSETLPVTAVSVGNPHAVCFTNGVATLDIAKYAPYFGVSDLFPDGVNAEFAEKTGEKEFFMRVWERGSGETMACGTGACATAAAAVRNGLCRAGDNIRIKLLGGDLTVKCGDDMRVIMTGSAEKVYDGVIDIDKLKQ